MDEGLQMIALTAIELELAGAIAELEQDPADEDARAKVDSLRELRLRAIHKTP